MFVLRSHEPNSECISRPNIGPVPATANDGERSRCEPVDLAADWQGRCPALHVAPRPEADGSSETVVRTRQHADASIPMPLFAAAFAVRFGGAKAESACPKHFADVQSLIATVSAGMDRARDRLPWDRSELVHALLDDARMLLDAAKRNHEHPNGPYDHARAFAKADAALGHARAAQVVCSRWTRD